MLHAIHIAIMQAGAGFRWADYDRFPSMQMHTLLGVGGSAVALTAAGDGLLTKIVRAAAKFVPQATKEGLGAT